MKKVGDIIESGEVILKVMKTYESDDPELWCKNRITLLNLNTGDIIDCADWDQILKKERRQDGEKYTAYSWNVVHLDGNLLH